MLEINVGHQVGSYRVVAEIAKGNYAQVYRAVHVIFVSRVVALKILHTTRLKSEQDHEGFFQEARILEQLKHPNILEVYDANIYDNYPYTVIEFASNGSLRDRLRKQKGEPLALAEARQILNQVGSGLAFAHKQNVVHTDLKPENILFDGENEAVLADFDIARVLNKDHQQAVGLGGTPSYMAPEQFQGKVRKESDQYALACIAYELLTGQRPFVGRDLATLQRLHTNEEPVSPREHNAAIPRQVEQAILTAMQKQYSQRYPDVEAFLDALGGGKRAHTLAKVEQKSRPEATPGHKSKPEPAPEPKSKPVSSGGHRGKVQTSDAKLILKGDAPRKQVDENIYYEPTVLDSSEVTQVDEAKSKATRSRKTSTTVKKTTSGERARAPIRKKEPAGPTSKATREEPAKASRTKKAAVKASEEKPVRASRTKRTVDNEKPATTARKSPTKTATTARATPEKKTTQSKSRVEAHEKEPVRKRVTTKTRQVD